MALKPWRMLCTSIAHVASCCATLAQHVTQRYARVSLTRDAPRASGSHSLLGMLGELPAKCRLRSEDIEGTIELTNLVEGAQVMMNESIGDDRDDVMMM